MEKKQRSIYVGTAIAFAALCILLCLYFLSVKILTDDADAPAYAHGSDSPAFADGWRYTDSGAIVDPLSGGKPYRMLRFAGGCAQIRRSIDRNIEPGQFLMFRADVSSVSALCGDTVLYKYSAEQESFAAPHGMRYFWIPVPELPAGETLTVRLEADSDGTRPVWYMALGSADALAMYILTQRLDTAVICFILILFAVLVLAFGVTHLLMRVQPVRRVYFWLSLSVLLAAIWIGADSGLFFVWIRNDILYYTLLRLSFMCLPGAAMMFAYHCGKTPSNFARIAGAADAAAALAAYVLYFFGVIGLDAVQPCFYLAAAVAAAYMAIRLIRGDIRRNVFYRGGILILLLSAALGLFLRCVRAPIPISLVFQYGMLAFVLCMTVYGMMDVGRLLILEKEAALAKSQRSFMENELFLTQIRSHFFYNTMNLLRGLIKMDPDAAYHLTEDFSKYIRSHVEAINVKGGIIPFAKELEAVEAYARISIIRLNGALHMEYDIETTDFEVPALTLEPLVENAIRHGIFPKGEGHVKVCVRETEAGFSVRVTDDGIGFENLEEGIGITNIRQRLRRYAGCRLDFESRPGVGTTAEIIYSRNIEEDTNYEDDVGRR